MAERTRGQEWAAQGEADLIRRNGGAALRVIAPYFVAGIEFDAKAKVGRAAPILRHAGVRIGLPVEEVFWLMDRKPPTWKLEWLT